MEDTQEPSATAAIDDLVSDSLGQEPSAPADTADVAAPPDTAATSSTETVDAPAPSAPDPAVASPPNADSAPVPAPAPIRLGDREYTAQELQAALTTAQQFGHLQNKYVEMLEQQKRGAAQPAPDVRGGMPQPLSPQQQMQAIRMRYDADVQKAVKDGLIEPDFASLFPGMAAQMLMYRDGFNAVSQQLSAVSQSMMQGQMQQQSQGLMQQIGQSIGNLAASGEAFASLKDPNVVQGFFKYLWDMDPKRAQVTNPEFLSRQWFAYNRDQYLQNQQRQAAEAARANQVRYARADATTGSRPPGVMQTPQATPLDQMVSDFYERGL